MNECERYQEQISAMLDGALSETESDEVREHVAGCADCGTLYAAFGAVSGSLEMVDVPDTLHADIMARLDAARPKPQGLLLRLRPALVTAACLAVIVGAVFAARPIFERGRSAAPAAKEAAAEVQMYGMTGGAEGGAASNGGPLWQEWNGATAAARGDAGTSAEADSDEAAEEPDPEYAARVFQTAAAEQWPNLELRSVAAGSFTAVVLSDPTGTFAEGQELTVIPTEIPDDSGEEEWLPGDRVWILFDTWAESETGQITVPADWIGRID